ncbi:MAG: hydantoinase/oxoprolinase family protein, partial [Acetobacteraceae bacterium]
AAYTRFYDRPVPGSDVEVLSFSVVVATAGGSTKSTPPAPEVQTKPPPIEASSAHTQRVRDGGTGAVADWAVFLRADLLAGQRVRGPAIIAEDETSTLISAGWSAVADKTGYLMLDKDGP